MVNELLRLTIFEAIKQKGFLCCVIWQRQNRFSDLFKLYIGGPCSSGRPVLNYL
jgi:hypothetical protein